MKPIKKGFLKRALGGIFRSPLVRGIVKSLPFGNVAYEVAENVIGETLNQSKTKDGDTKPHSAISLLCQIVVLGLIVYAFITKQIDINDVLNMLGVSADDFKDYHAPTVTIINDTLK